MPLLYDTPDAVDLYRSKSAGALQAHRVQPELSVEVVADDVNVRRLIPVGDIEHEPVGPISINRRHRVESLSPAASLCKEGVHASGNGDGPECRKHKKHLQSHLKSERSQFYRLWLGNVDSNHD